MKKLNKKIADFIVFLVTFLLLIVSIPFGTYAASSENNSVSYEVHCQSYGWMNSVSDGKTAGTSGESKRLEAIKIDLNTSYDGQINYQVHKQTYGWMPEAKDREIAGTTGDGKRLEAIKIWLSGEVSEYYDVYYRVHVQSYGWMSWVKNGEIAGTCGERKRVEAIEIKLVKKINETEISILCNAHIQSIGWKNVSGNSIEIGTTGQSKRLEAIKLDLNQQKKLGTIEYKSHIQGYGWENSWRSSGEISGTEGESKRLEAICIRFTGELAENYDIYYRVHAQSYGWLGWTKNGEKAGTEGLAKRIEALEIIIVRKGETGPDTNKKAFIKASPASESMRRYTSDIISKCTNSSMSKEQKLRACYKWVLDNCSYKPILENVKTGYTKEEYYAEIMFETHKGNCFAYASAFTQLAKALGYTEARTAFGETGKRGGGYTPHGWTVIGSRIFDPEMEDVYGLPCYGTSPYKYRE